MKRHGFSKFSWLAALACAACVVSRAGADDWPMVHHDTQRSGYTTESVTGPYQLNWVAQWPSETLSTRFEPIVADGRVFVATIQGGLHALDSATGRPLWSHRSTGSFQHSPAYGSGRVFAADTDGSVWALDAATGQVIWHRPLDRNGFVTSPLLANGLVLLGSRSGTFFALNSESGATVWQNAVGGPIRCTAAQAGKLVVYAADDMRARAADIETGQVRWESAKLNGQSFRDYYPVVVGQHIVLRSVLVTELNDDLNGGTQFLAQLAGIGQGRSAGWREVEDFLKSDRTDASPERIRDEQRAILERLEREPQRKTFFVLDAATGAEVTQAPVMYIAGNQGNAVPPVVSGDGRVIAHYRTVYSNWNLGVKPAVGLGAIDLASGHITPIRHASGNTPPWNTFWGTCDEAINFSVGDNLLYISHQGTLSTFDLTTRQLGRVWGNRDTWGGFLAPIWAANEWHGPARGSCAIADGRIYWATGSRVLCLSSSQPGDETPDIRPEASTFDRPRFPVADVAELDKKLDAIRLVAERQQIGVPDMSATAGQRTELQQAVGEYLNGRPWAPLYVQMGIGSRDFYFAHPSHDIQALSLALPYLPPPMAETAREVIVEMLPAALNADALPLDRGRRRELYDVPTNCLTWSYHPQWPPISHVYAVWLYGDRSGDWEPVERLWPRMQQIWREYAQRPLDLSSPDADRRLLHANRVAAGIIAYARMARRMLARAEAAEAERELDRLLAYLLDQYRAQAQRATETLERELSQGDTMHNQARWLYRHLNNHKSKLVTWLDLTPEVARYLAARAPAETAELRAMVEVYFPTYYLAWEERQVHYGENFIELPDSMHGLFLAHAWLWQAPPERLSRHVDMPWCQADLYYIERLVRAIESRATSHWTLIDSSPR